MRDLVRPELVFQLVHPDIAHDFPPLKSLEAFSNNLPPQITSFIGRESDIAGIRGRLREARLLTILGPGGVGKTRLTLQVSAEVVDEYPDGVWLIELGSVSDGAFVIPCAATALSIQEDPNRPLEATLVDRLRERTSLLVVDNCEHLIEERARLVDMLLRGCPRVHVLVTSREPLGIAGEHIWRARPLPTPDQLSQYDAVRLFITRSRSVNPSFAVNDDNAPAVAQVCWRLDGIPLLIEIAAARMRTLSVQQIERLLDNRFQLLTGGNRVAVPRQQTVRALIDWSYELLTETERSLFDRLAVFEGTFAVEAAEEVCDGDGVERWEIVDILSRLVDRSLVATTEESESPGYYLLSTLRAYGLEHLHASGALDGVRRRHVEYLVEFAEEAAAERSGPNQAAIAAQLDDRYHDFRAALGWALDNDLTLCFRLVAALGPYCALRGYWTEGREWLERCLPRAEPVPAHLQAKVFLWAGRSLWGKQESTRAEALFRMSYDKAREAGETSTMVMALRQLAIIKRIAGLYGESAALYRDTLALQETHDDQRTRAETLHDLSVLALDAPDYTETRARSTESLRIRRELGDSARVAASLSTLGSIAFAEGRFTTAARLQKEALELNRRVGDKKGQSYALRRLARAARELVVSDSDLSCYPTPTLTLPHARGRDIASAPREAWGRIEVGEYDISKVTDHRTDI
ncbi:tetratricopeptide repeat protein [Candidatus Poribacteria bacterium]|nr:tetratricopeptide repeat protein [Candidatus Poribacteria bacterium]